MKGKNNKIFYILLSILFIVSLYIFQPFLTEHSIFGFGADPFYCAKITQLVSQKFAKGLSPFHNSFWDLSIYYPSNRALAFSDPFILPGFLSFIMTHFLRLNFILSLNIIFFINVCLNWLCCYLFFNAVLNSKEYSLLGGWFWAFSIHLQTQYFHFQNTMAFGIPLCYYSLFHLRSSLKIKYLFLLAFSFFILACTNIYNYYFTILTSPFLFLLIKIEYSKRKRIFEILKRLITISPILPLALIPSLFISYRYMEVKSYYPEFESQKSLAGMLENSIILSDLISVSIVKPIYASIIPHIHSFERNALSGLFTLVFAIFQIFIFVTYYIFNRKNLIPKLLLPFKVATLLFTFGFFLAAGANYFSICFQFLAEYLPGFVSLRAIGRASSLIVMAECLFSILFLLTLKTMFQRSKVQNLTYIIILLFIIMQITERIIPNYKNFKIDTDKIMADEKETLQFLSNYKRKDGSVLEIDLDNIEDPSPFLAKSLFHKLKVVNGYSAFNLGSHIAIRDMGIQLKANIISPEYKAILSITSILLITSKNKEIPIELEKYLKIYFPMKKNIGQYFVYYK